MHRLTIHPGWPYLILGVLILVGALRTVVPFLVSWARFEIQLARRAGRYEVRSEAARDARASW